MLTSSAKNKPTKLLPENQLKKTQKNAKRLREQIERNKQELHDSKTSPERKKWIELAVMKLEKKLTKTIISCMALEGKVAHAHELQDKAKADKAKAEANRKANAAKIKVQEPKYGIIQGFHPGLAGKGRIVERIEKVGTKRRVRRKWMDK
jgi:hypothetical protein